MYSKYTLESSLSFLLGTTPKGIKTILLRVVVPQAEDDSQDESHTKDYYCTRMTRSQAMIKGCSHYKPNPLGTSGT